MSSAFDRRRFLTSLAGATAGLCGTSLFAAGVPEISMKTYTYKKAGDLEIKADVYRPDDDVIIRELGLQLFSTSFELNEGLPNAVWVVFPFQQHV